MDKFDKFSLDDKVYFRLASVDFELIKEANQVFRDEIKSLQKRIDAGSLELAELTKRMIDIAEKYES